MLAAIALLALATSNHPLLFGTVSPTTNANASSDGLHYLSNHPLLFGTVSPTDAEVVAHGFRLNSNHPLLFGTVSPTMTTRSPMEVWVTG